MPLSSAAGWTRPVTVQQAQHLHVETVPGAHGRNHVVDLLPPRQGHVKGRQGAERRAGRVEQNKSHSAAHAGNRNVCDVRHVNQGG